MTKIEVIQKKRKKKLESLTKRELVKMIMKATIFSDTYLLLLEDDPMLLVNGELTIKAIHRTLS